jgi:hypothetical protein
MERQTVRILVRVVHAAHAMKTMLPRISHRPPKPNKPRRTLQRATRNHPQKDKDSRLKRNIPH